MPKHEQQSFWAPLAMLADRKARERRNATDMFRLWSSAAGDVSFDVYGDWIVVSDYRDEGDMSTASNLSQDAIRDDLAAQDSFQNAAPELPSAYQDLKVIYLRRPRATQHGAADASSRVLLGAASEDDPDYHQLVLREWGLAYELALDAPLNAGIFLDSSRLRALVTERSEGKRVLNLFAYTGGFSLAAYRGGAIHIDTVDLSPRYVAWAERNMQAAGAEDDRERWGYFAMDSLAFVQRFASKRGPYDFIIVDPPTFARARKKRGKAAKRGQSSKGFSLVRDAVELLQELAEQLSPGGDLLFVCNKRGFELPPRIAGFAKIQILEDTIPEGYQADIHRAWLLTSAELS